MSHVFETRCVSANLSDPRGVTRVACIGDSMLYGFGAQSRQTMPAHLGTVLNAAYPDRLIFVDNFGQTSGNIWNSWPLFKANAERMRFDAVVFSICQNDLELFDGNQVHYSVEARNRSFEEGTPTWAAATALLTDIADWTRDRGIDPLIFFYSYYLGDRPLADRLAVGCEAAGIAFVDTLKYLREETGLTPQTFIATEFDGHPSSLAHEHVARRLAREMRSRNFLSRAPRLTVGPRAGVVAAVTSMIEQGMQADDALSWASDLCDTKAAALRRLLAGAPAKDMAAWKSTRNWAGAALSSWRTHLRQELRGRALEADFAAHDNNFANLSGHRRRFEELAYVLSHQRTGAETADLCRQFEGTAHRTSGRIKDFDGDIGLSVAYMKAKLDSFSERMGTDQKPPTAAGRLLRLNGALPFAAQAGLAGQLAREIALMDRAARAFAAFLSRRGEKRPAASPEQFLHALLILAFRQFATFAEKLLDAADSTVRLSQPHGPPFTIVQVTVEGAVGETVAEKTFELIAVLVYAVPRRGVIRNRFHAGAVKDRAVYQFEFPLVLEGQLTVGLPERGIHRDLFLDGRARIADIQIGNADAAMNIATGGHVISWRNEGENTAQIRLPILLS